MGGLTMVHEPDIQGSSNFLRKVLGDRHLEHACGSVLVQAKC